jgi:hypothetical protein
LINEELKRLEEKVNSNEFWGMSSGEHLNIINRLIVEARHLQQENEQLKRLRKERDEQKEKARGYFKEGLELVKKREELKRENECLKEVCRDAGRLIE